MLKWLVTGREGGEAVLGSISSQPRSVSVNNTDDPLAAAVGCNSDNNNYNLFKVNRLVIMEKRPGELPQRKLTSCPLISFHILLRRLEIPGNSNSSFLNSTQDIYQQDNLDRN